MNYRHAFHAGNFADVFKHALLVRLLRALQRKEKGFLYLDTHAGRGAYDLLARPTGPAPVERSPEWPGGIGRLWNTADLPEPLADYVALVREFNRGSGAGETRLRHYPGSPWLAALVRRPQDRLALWEQQPGETRVLCRRLGRKRRITITAGDGYGALRATLPPAERRALVFIDPPFEAPDEFDCVRRALGEGMERFATGVYAVWYPVTKRAKVETFQACLQAAGLPATYWAELAVTDAPDVRMKGCGLLVINPPWKFAEDVDALLPSLASTLGVDAGATGRSGWLTPET